MGFPDDLAFSGFKVLLIGFCRYVRYVLGTFYHSAHYRFLKLLFTSIIFLHLTSRLKACGRGQLVGLVSCFCWYASSYVVKSSLA